MNRNGRVGRGLEEEMEEKMRLDELEAYSVAQK